MRKEIAITINSAWNIANFRANLISAFRATGYEVIAIAPADRYASRVTELGCAFVPLSMDNSGTNPLRDLSLLVRYYLVLRRLRPSILLPYTIKPNIYGSIAAHLLGIPVLNNIAGLGTSFLGGRWLNLLVRALYKLSLSRSRRVFFQNKEDQALFVDAGLVRSDQACLLPGSGVDTVHFAPRPSSRPSRRPFRFLFSGRVLWDKGIGEYVQAARLLRSEGVAFEAQVLGFVDVKNPSAVSGAQIAAWVDEGTIDFLGEAEDVRSSVADADCVVLPSYREGTPRSLLEAASMGKPVITTDVPGCRDVVVDGISGYAVPPKDVPALAAAMRRIANLTAPALEQMGEASRSLALARFNEEIVINAYRKVVVAITSSDGERK